jgi:hypothetical protein
MPMPLPMPNAAKPPNNPPPAFFSFPPLPPSVAVSLPRLVASLALMASIFAKTPSSFLIA